MTAANLAKGAIKAGCIVAVIASPEDFQRALRLRRPPDFFELRLDALQPFLSQLSSAISQLCAPLIITARHPAEGGKNNLSAFQRRTLLQQFLPRAACIDIELRSIHELKTILPAPPCLIISVHPAGIAIDPDRALVQAEAAGADVFKLVTRTDTVEQTEALRQFFARNKNRLPISVMGAGRLGRKARSYFAKAGSVLNYAHLGAANIEGQLSLAEIRLILRR